MSSFERFEESAGEPDVQLAGLKIWVHGYQFPDADNDDDADWLTVTVRCDAPGASVWWRGPYLMRSELQYLRDGAERLHRDLSGSVTLECLEPYLAISIAFRGQLGATVAAVDITPEHMSQDHHFEFEIDQSYLGDLVRSCDGVLKTYSRVRRQAI